MSQNIFRGRRDVASFTITIFVSSRFGRAGVPDAVLGDRGKPPQEVVMRWSAMLIGLACFGVGCGTSETSVDQAVSESKAASIVDVTVIEFSVTATPAGVPAGRVLFRAHNDSGDIIHEFVVVKTELTIAELPTNPDGSFDEEGEGVEVIDEVETINTGATRALNLILDSGHYVLLCNRIKVLDTGEVISHFAEGMRTDFNVD
jgi:hypothetical protein